jgi:hypothetical protein
LEDLVNRTLVRCKHAAVGDVVGAGNGEQEPASKRARISESVGQQQEGGAAGVAVVEDGEAGGVGGGCSWTGRLGDVEAHLASSCGFELVECTRSLDERVCECVCGDGCDILVARRELERHVASECLHRPVPCQYCNDNCCFDYLEAHEEQCDEKEEECVNKGCGVVMKIGVIGEHYNICQFQTVACPCPGCETELVLHELPAHMAASTENHVLGLIKRDAEHSRETRAMETRMRQEVGVAAFEWRVARGWGGARGSSVYSQEVRCGQFKISLGFSKLQTLSGDGVEQFAFEVQLRTPSIRLVAHAEILVSGSRGRSKVKVPRIDGQFVTGPHRRSRPLPWERGTTCSSAPFSPGQYQSTSTLLEGGVIGVKAVVRLSIATEFDSTDLPLISDQAGQEDL